LGDLGVTYAHHLQLVGKPVVNFILAIIEFFRYLLRLRCHKRKSVEVGVFKEVGHFEAEFYVEGLFFALISMDDHIGEWPYYNFGAGSFHTQELCSRLYSMEVDFYSKNDKIVL